jgi:hypothetical protein
MRVAGVDVVGEFAARAFQRAAVLARKLEVFAQALDFGLERGGLLFDLVEFGAQRLVRRAAFVEHALEAEAQRLFLLERAQRVVERNDDLVEGKLEIVELADLAAGVGKKMTQGLVFFADARSDVGDVFKVARVVVATQAGPRRTRLWAPAAKQTRQLTHDFGLPRRTLRVHAYGIKLL